MAGMTNYLEDNLVDHALGTAAFTMPTAVFVKLHTGDPGEDATANASAETLRIEATFGASSGGVAALASDLTWSGWDSGNETISHISIWDAVTAGNPLLKGALSVSRAVVDTDDLVLDAGTTTVTFA